MQVYEPHHAKGEDHQYDYLGMLGIPMELTLPTKLKGEADIGFFAYDNGAFVLESFADTPRTWHLEVPQGCEIVALGDGLSAKPAHTKENGCSVYEVRIQPSTIGAFRCVPAS